MTSIEDGSLTMTSIEVALTVWPVLQIEYETLLLVRLLMEIKIHSLQNHCFKEGPQVDWPLDGIEIERSVVSFLSLSLSLSHTMLGFVVRVC
ncbi:hypothetical protein QVD17_41347 [Tagetes erecta]|uniref:Uncharacterized protein n=1 Tax=Tagetes erecta TaxID=13708 RepID=A0AAD8JT33_TARER|nr:hypothetical protein QVD17_41347 [Tagetes erecta]